MKIKGKTLLVSVENEIKVGRHDAIEATVETLGMHTSRMGDGIAAAAAALK